MSDSSSTYPTGFTFHITPVRSCGRLNTAGQTTASFAIGETYSVVCGRITAIQKGLPNGFGPFYHDCDLAHYIDGIGTRHGSAYNQCHVWSFAVGGGETISDIQSSCPCGHDQWNYSQPLFLNYDYFCETGNRGDSTLHPAFLDDPLWNGKGCAVGNCCEFNNPPCSTRSCPR